MERKHLQIAVAAAGLAGVSLGLLKVVTGRSRPDLGQGQGAYDFHPFGGGGSLPAPIIPLSPCITDAVVLKRTLAVHLGARGFSAKVTSGP